MIEKNRSALWILVLLPASVFVLALFLGRYGIQVQDTVRVLLGMDGPSDVFRALILRVRLPRVLAAACVGANLSVVGAAFQGLFRNPLVDSRILGVSSGAAFGAALA
ncbi:MAG: iron chelate uptake ABC transporter family permease subunit, partial [Dehalococcoidia bacterium]|nr:iron chelate uptake ABC transporter family permease subunit [Dehalococcoidia bacterium]